MPLKRLIQLAAASSLLYVPHATAVEPDRVELAVYAGVTIYPNPIYDSVVVVEFPFSLNRQDFEFYRPDSADRKLYARIFAQVDLMDMSGLVVDSARTYFSVRVSSYQESRLADYRIFNKLVTAVKPGVYSARLTVIDAVNKNQGEFFFDMIEVEPIEKERISIGGICLAYGVEHVGENSPKYNPRLYKHGFNVLVNPVSIFSVEDTIVYLFGESYNLAYSDSAQQEYQLTLTALDNNGSVYQSYGSRISKKPGATSVITESFDIKGWSQGSYELLVVVTDFETNLADTARVPFHIVSTADILVAASWQHDLIDPYDKLSAKEKVNLVTYHLTPEQKRVLSSLSDSAKLVYLDQYWREHDEDPSTKTTENRNELIRRFEFSNRHFSSNEKKTDGWATDRGRIYMTYGPWDERDDFQAPRVGNAYEIWHYRMIKEGKIFIFEDWTGSQDYRLVHSNVYGEVYSRAWQDRINQGYIDVYE